jgi:predicted RNA binding protein YcfA (HicA-like mRNA interferase family)
MILIEGMKVSALGRGILAAVRDAGSRGARFDGGFMRKAKGGKTISNEFVVDALNTLVGLNMVKTKKQSGATYLMLGPKAPATESAGLDEMAVRNVLKKLKKAGCTKKRQKGSHQTLQCPVDRQTTVPVHAGGRDVPKGTLKAIEKQSGVKL